jgi:cell division protein FtsL
MDEGQQQPQFQQVSTPADTDSPARKKPIAVTILGLLVILLIVLTGFTYVNWQHSKKQLKTSQAQLAAKSNELREATAQLIPYRDTV